MPETVWDVLNREQRYRKKLRLLLFACCLFSLAITTFVAVTFLDGLRESGAVSEFLVARARNNDNPVPDIVSAERIVVPVVAGAGEGAVDLKSAAPPPFDARGARDNTPLFQEDAQMMGVAGQYGLLVDDSAKTFVPAASVQLAGPRQVSFVISSTMKTQTHTVGIAVFSMTEISGAAGEWRVRPWWRPGWLPGSADCGQPGTTVIAGHVSWYAQPGPFYELASLREGDEVRCQSNDGSWHVYEVTAAWSTAYNDVLSYWMPPQDGEGSAVLSLYTCTREITGIHVVRAKLNRESS